MAVDNKDNVEVIETEELVDGQLRRVRRTIRTKVEEEVVVVEEEPAAETSTRTIVTTENIYDNPQQAANDSLAQLVCQCITPSGKTAYCLVSDNHDGTYTVDINASEPGVHTVDVELNGKKIPGSPFLVRIVQAADKKKVLLYGNGLGSTLLDDAQSTIHVDTKGAGPGDLKVRVHGPKNGFSVDLKHDYHDNRVVNIDYNPTIAGLYTINVYWSGEHVSGSPAEVYLAPNEDLLDTWHNDPEKIREVEGLSGKY